MKKIIFAWLLLILIVVSSCTKEKSQVPATGKTIAESGSVPMQKLKILTIASYHQGWEFTDEQLRGFKDSLADLNIEYKDFYMDTKRKSTEAEKQESARLAKELISAWKPNLVFTSDDDAQQYIVKYYINSTLPFIFSGVNKEPSDYGYEASKNIAGILERFLFVDTLNLLREISPSIHKIAAISDNSPFWMTEMNRAKKLVAGHYSSGEIEFVSWDVISTFNEYKDKITEYQSKADALVLFGLFTLTYENGTWTPFTDVQKWTVNNSMLPDMTFAADPIRQGTLAAIAISPYDMGSQAGIMAKGILAEGKNPSDFSYKSSYKGTPMINLKRANELGIKIGSNILLTATVIDNYAWENITKSVQR